MLACPCVDSMLMWPCVGQVRVLSLLHCSCPTVWVGRSRAQTVCWMAWEARVVNRMPCTLVLMAYRALEGRARLWVFFRFHIYPFRSILSQHAVYLLGSI